MTGAKTESPRPLMSFGGTLSIEHLMGVAAELQSLRHNPPLVRREDGKYEGDILGFVRGLRLSAQVVYFLREHLSHTSLEVSWGHILDENEQSCSPECDVIIHSKGFCRQWNGTKNPVMEFRFVHAASVRAVVSCKSSLDRIDKDYPKALKKYGVANVFLFAECCREKRFPRLRQSSLTAGYCDLCCLYLVGDDDSTFKTDGPSYVEFGKNILKAVKS
jgi:hypothetical protein